VSTIIILFVEMLNYSKKYFTQFVFEENKESFGIFYSPTGNL
jgi:hypothetical protein